MPTNVKLAKLNRRNFKTSCVEFLSVELYHKTLDAEQAEK